MFFNLYGRFDLDLVNVIALVNDGSSIATSKDSLCFCCSAGRNITANLTSLRGVMQVQLQINNGVISDTTVRKKIEQVYVTFSQRAQNDSFLYFAIESKLLRLGVHYFCVNKSIFTTACHHEQIYLIRLAG